MKDAFKVKKGLNIQPTDPADVVNPEAGDLIVDSTDDNRLKVYDPTSSEFAAVGTGGSSGNILSDIEKLTPTVSNVVAVTDTTTFLPIDDNNKSVKATFSGSDGSIRYEGPASADLDGVQGVVKVWIKTDVEGLSLVATKDGVAQNNGLTVNSTNKWRQYEIPVVLGDADYGFEIQASGAVSGDVYIDEAFVTVERVIQQLDTTIGDFKEYAPTIKGANSDPSLGTATVKSFYRKLGDSLEIKISVNQSVSGTAGNGLYFFTLPDGYTIDFNKIANGGFTSQGVVGSASLRVASTNFTGSAHAHRVTGVGEGISIYADTATSNGDYIGSSVFSIANATWRVSLSAIVPVNELSSEKSTVVTQNTELTAKTANELEAFVNNTGSLVSENYNGWVTPTRTAQGFYTYDYSSLGLTHIPNFRCSVVDTADTTNIDSCNVTSVTTTSANVNITRAGGYRDTGHRITLAKMETDVNKSATIVGKFENINSTDLVVVRASGNSGTEVTALTPINFTENYDPTNSWNGTTFTVPTGGAGEYSIVGGTIFTANTNGRIILYKNNSEFKVISMSQSDSTTSAYAFSGTVFLNEGDTIDLRHNITRTLSNNSVFHHLHIMQLPDTESIIKNLSNQKVECQTKYLQANATTSGILSDLTFSNLIIGKKYQVQTNFRITETNTSSNEKYGLIAMSNNADGISNVIADAYTRTTTTRYQATLNPGKIFVAVNSILTTNFIQVSNVGVAGASTRYGWVELCELPDTYVETTKF